jgi:hypothetical protein
MIPFARAAMIVTVLMLPLGGCVNFDPQDWFAGDWFHNKKPLAGQRRELFPGGVPGVTHGVPSDLVKGNQATALQEAEEPRVIIPEEPKAAPKPKVRAKPKPKPKPKVVEDTSEPDRRPTSVTVRPQSQPPVQRSQQAQWPDPPGTQRPQQQQPSIWPDPPTPR